MMNKVTKTIPFTTKKYREMQEKVKQLELEKEAVMQRLVEARAMGDLSENGAYKYAKFELANIKRQLRRFQSLLAKGFPAPKNTGAKGVIDFASQVRVQKLDGSKKELSFTIVSKHESNPLEGKIAYSSPMGRALVRKKVGEVVKVKTPVGEKSFLILAVS